MADEPQVLCGINWREAFPFTHIFRAFRIAVHPSKLVLALAAVLCLYFGGRVLDRVWMRQYRAVPGEVELYERSVDREAFGRDRDVMREVATDAYARMIQRVGQVKGGDWNGVVSGSDKAKAAARDGQYEGDVRYWIGTERQKAVEGAYKTYEASKKDDPAAKELRQGVQTAYQDAGQRLAAVDAVNGRGLFAVFFDYQRQQVRKVADSVLAGNWLGGIGGIGGPDGVYKSAFKFFTSAPAWAIQYHWVYFLIYGALFLFVWSLFGGAIARIAAVHVADEGRKLSMRQGLSFAVSKFLSFLSAPLIPLIIVVGLGLVVAVVSGVAFLVYLDVAVGVFYFLALAAGFVMTLVVLGTAGGLNLMYPTIAVEGSDSFDAISRSFSYVYAKPWRMLFYSTVAVGYGAVCYLFVRLFVWLVLLLAHVSVGLFVFRNADNMSSLWPTLQPVGGSLNLPRGVNFEALNWYGDLTAGLLSIWVYLMIAMLAAFAISFYFSASTIIYYLIRRDTDATEMDDVYLEQPEEDFAETGVGGAAAAAAGDGSGTAESGSAGAGTPSVPDETMTPPSASDQTPAT
jgi:hypothetical protein